jgi:hypothetical protein
VREINIESSENFDVHTLKVLYQHFFEEGEREAVIKYNNFSFYTVGHLYGTPDVNASHPHPPFVTYTPQIAENGRLEFGILLGDLVTGPAVKNYAGVMAVMEKTGKTFYAVPGNHDEGDGGVLFDRYFGGRFRYFSRGNNLFIFLDPNPKDDGVSPDQIDMIRKALAENETAKNIFVFTHELFWLYLNDQRFNNFTPNNRSSYTPLMPENFRRLILPLFDTAKQNIYFIAGDTGAFPNGREIFYVSERRSESQIVEENNSAPEILTESSGGGGVWYIATGLGSNTKDNILEFDITMDDEVSIQLIALNGTNPNALGRLEDHELKRDIP